LTLDLSTEATTSFLEKEESLATLLNHLGLLATESLLKESSQDSKRMEVEGQAYYQKNLQKKHTKAPTAK
jgi:hypothetical protein